MKKDKATNVYVTNTVACISVGVVMTQVLKEPERNEVEAVPESQKVRYVSTRCQLLLYNAFAMMTSSIEDFYSIALFCILLSVLSNIDCG